MRLTKTPTYWLFVSAANAGTNCLSDSNEDGSSGAVCARQKLLVCCRGGRPDYDDSGDVGRGGGDWVAVVVADPTTTARSLSCCHEEEGVSVELLWEAV